MEYLQDCVTMIGDTALAEAVDLGDGGEGGWVTAG